VLGGGAVGGDLQWGLWAFCAALLWLTPRFTTVEGFVIAAAHFVERHGLVIIVAIGESIVVIGAGAAELPLDEALLLVALLSLALSAALWWTYFSDENAIEHAFSEAPEERRPQLALAGFGYWHYGLLLGIVAFAAGLKKAIGDPYETLDELIAVELGAGVALFLLCDVGFRRTLGLRRSEIRLAAAAFMLATIPLGTEVAATAQVGALAVIATLALAVEGSRYGRRGSRQQSK
jgi:low temperature requirement protein LtrA